MRTCSLRLSDAASTFLAVRPEELCVTTQSVSQLQAYDKEPGSGCWAGQHAVPGRLQRHSKMQRGCGHDQQEVLQPQESCDNAEHAPDPLLLRNQSQEGLG